MSAQPTAFINARIVDPASNWDGPGALLVRDTWEEDANWFGLINGKAQLFRGGTRKDIKEGVDGELQLGPALILFGANTRQFHLNNEEKETVFLIGLKPGGRYDVEVDGEEMQEHKADAGGVIGLQFPPSKEIGVRIKDAGK